MTFQKDLLLAKHKNGKNVSIKIGNKVFVEHNESLYDAIADFVALKNCLTETQMHLNFHRDKIIGSATKYIEGDCRQSTVTMNNIKVKFTYDSCVDEQKAREILGDRFDDLVMVSTKFKPSKKLLCMAISDDTYKNVIEITKKQPSISVIKE